MEDYPQLRLLDIYKSCFQDYMGAEHLVNDTASARVYLMEELTVLDGSDSVACYYEPCGLNGNYYRVSLRAVKDGLLSAEALLDAFVRSANSFQRPSLDEWIAQWKDMLGELDLMKINLPHYEDDKQYIFSVLDQGRYAISHSPDYRNAYHPHYRIVAREIFEREILPLLP